MNNYLVQANHISKSFGDTHAVDDVSLQIKSGEIYGLVGSDGAGKTTVMRLLVGALLADSGEINICGFDINKQTEDARAQFGYLSQRFSMYEDLSVLKTSASSPRCVGYNPTNGSHVVWKSLCSSDWKNSPTAAQVSSLEA